MVAHQRDCHLRVHRRRDARREHERRTRQALARRVGVVLVRRKRKHARGRDRHRVIVVGAGVGHSDDSVLIVDGRGLCCTSVGDLDRPGGARRDDALHDRRLGRVAVVLVPGRGVVDVAVASIVVAAQLDDLRVDVLHARGRHRRRGGRHDEAVRPRRHFRGGDPVLKNGRDPRIDQIADVVQVHCVRCAVESGESGVHRRVEHVARFTVVPRAVQRRW